MNKQEIILNNDEYIISLKTKNKTVIQIDDYINNIRGIIKNVVFQIKDLNKQKKTLLDLYHSLLILKEDIETNEND